jgi:hypothetical protein
VNLGTLELLRGRRDHMKQSHAQSSVWVVWGLVCMREPLTARTFQPVVWSHNPEETEGQETTVEREPESVLPA